MLSIYPSPLQMVSAACSVRPSMAKKSMTGRHLSPTNIYSPEPSSGVVGKFAVGEHDVTEDEDEVVVVVVVGEVVGMDTGGAVETGSVEAGSAVAGAEELPVLEAVAKLVGVVLTRVIAGCAIESQPYIECGETSPSLL